MLVQLYPTPSRDVPFNGAYLAHNLRQKMVEIDDVFVYANFITSVDGRIAIPDSSNGGLIVPKSTTNARDWRLFQELVAQADLIISSGRYLRDWANGKAQEILQVDDPRFEDLRSWREEHKLAPQPDIAIISSSLQFPVPDVLTAGGRKFIVLTARVPDQARVKQIERKSGQVIIVGDNHVDGRRMVNVMKELGYRMVFSAAGPKILHLLLSGGMLNRLYVTYANRILGGDPFSSIVDGPLIKPAVDLRINSIYLDPNGLDGTGQLFVSYDVQK
jgi:riboflavin biosynthesis pyrimidine reductase